MSGSTGGEKPLSQIEVVSATTGLRVLGFTPAGSPRAIEPAAFAQAPGGTVSLSDAAAQALNTTGVAGSSTLASRADHRHPFPTATQVGAAAAVHGHAVADVSGLQGSLDAKSNTNHTHAISGVSGLQSALDGKAPIAHTHAIGDINQLQTTLDTKANLALRGVVNGLAPLDASGRVPAANLPAATTGATNVNNGNLAGDVPSWNPSTARYDPVQPRLPTANRIPTLIRNSPTVLTFTDYNGRNVVLTGNAPLTLAASEVGLTGDQGIAFLIKNRHTAINTITFGAGITVDPYPLGTGTAGAVKIAAMGSVAVQVYPTGTTLIAEVRGQIV